ncbi:MAG: DUF4239 domain-containing protein [Magnetospirillum sp.]|nr:DUF4239 domain-containing protein [Magnetospirillum sp.]
MIYDIVYAMDQWLAMVTVVGLTIAFALAGLFVVTRLVPLSVRTENQDGLGVAGATVGVVYAVLLAFIAVAVWEAFEKADDTAALEAALVGDIFRDAQLLPQPVRDAVTEGARSYADHVVTVEWPAMATGALPDRRGWEILEAIPAKLVNDSLSPGQMLVAQEAFSQINKVYDARRNRLSQASAGVQPLTWAVVLVGSLISLGFCWLLSFPSPWLHVLATSLVSGVLGMILFLIIAFDYPFRGTVQIGPDAFVMVQGNMQRLSQAAPAS